MEMYNVPEQGHAGAYMIQGAEPAQITSPLLQNFETMFNEGVPEFVVDQGLYYPTTTNYGYLCTGFESPSDWDDHQRIFGLDGQDIQYMGAPNENLPYLYYTPNYEYAESAYNPYNPYIPGAVVGVDGSYLGAQQYYTISAYENNVSSPSYFPVVLPNTSDVMVNRADTVIESNISAANRADGSRLKHNLSSASPIFTPSLLRPASGHNNFNRGSESAKYNARSGKQPVMHGNIASDRFSIRPSEGKVSQATRSVGHGKALSNHVQLRASVPSSNDSSHLGSGAHERVSAGKGGLLYGRVPNDVNVSPDSLNEQNRGPRTNRSKNQLVVKAYTSRAGNVDAQGNIVIHADEYNRDNFQLDLLNAKFFVIKSYSEDDVHKSIKYNVWSSTPNGNKKLNSAFEDAQRVPAGDPRGCPVFLFFSVNASGQFCGVAEMTGPVNFYKDMDFWQQDKWSGSFPVKWHIIKDVPNPNFRHIILENNENKPVTNSRDTQEIHYKKGIEMLKVFKNYASGTSLLDDFLYYETRQKFLQEEKAKLLVRSYENPFFVPVLDPPRKLNSIFDFPSSEGETISKHNDSEHTENCVVPAELDFIDSKTNKKNASDGDKFMVDEDRNTESALRIASLTINPKDVKSQTPEAECTTAVTLASAESVDVVTVGSMPIKVNGFAESSGFISIGTIPLDPRALQRD
ncbi:YTH domain-containing protein ECT3 isoform X2 [Lycium ferocissimum]|uniref:YTH domain-containing protein ECT3 isoform X2 n=1 Tax=Lycium ferocissimum TaxID=112874 RepID=UPI002814B508|nr:YTH domain-containing protein ECT3 isoform X2 [Lycium ferocissimum]